MGTRRGSWHWLAPLLALGVATPALASPQVVETRANQVRALFNERPEGLETLLEPSFHAKYGQVVRDYLRSTYQELGACREVKLRPRSAVRADLEFRFDHRVWLPGSLVVQATGDQRISGFVLHDPVRGFETWAAASAEFRQLPGTASFACYRLEAAGPRVVGELGASDSLAIGSAFKLYLLGALVEDIEQGRRKWSDVVSLDVRAMSLPSGLLQDWPVGAPVTLHTLASLMISRSDNTATDHLLRVLGRTRVERMLATMGHHQPERDRPLLSTMELFKLKGARAAAYLPLAEQGRRHYLETQLPRMSEDEITFSGADAPTGIDTLEWFASTADLARALDWLRRHTEAPATRPGRELMAINPGVPLPGAELAYVGYKGGSEPGVLNLSFLLRTEAGAWYALVATWNDPRAALDEKRLFGLAPRFVPLLVGDR